MNLTLVGPPLNHVPKHHTYMVFQHFQGWYPPPPWAAFSSAWLLFQWKNFSYGWRSFSVKKYFMATESATGVFPIVMSGQNINCILKICVYFLLNEATGWLALAEDSEEMVSAPSSALAGTQRPGSHFVSPPLFFCWLFTQYVQAQFGEHFLICGGALEQCRHLHSARKQEVLWNPLGVFGKTYPRPCRLVKSPSKNLCN